VDGGAGMAEARLIATYLFLVPRMP